MRMLLALAGTAIALSATACAQHANASDMVAREIALLQFYGGGTPLTPPERQEAAAIIQQGLRDDPESLQRGDAASARLLSELAGADGRLVTLARVVGRRNEALHMAASPKLRAIQAREESIISAHDPIVVLDAAHQRVITRMTVLSMLRADAEAASLFHVVPANIGDVGAMTTAVKTAYPGLDDGMQNMLAHAEEDLPYALPYLEKAPPQKRSAFVAEYRPKILAVSNPVDQQLRLAEVLAGAGMAGSRNQAAQTDGTASRASMLARLREQDVMQRQLLGASRSFSPTCNVPSGANQENFSFCHP